MFQQENISVNVLELTPIVHVKEAIIEQLNKDLVKEILEIKKNLPASPDTSSNCWRTAFNVGNDENQISEKCGNAVLEIVQNALGLFQSTIIEPTNLYVDSKKSHFEPPNLAVDAWVNVNKKGGANIYHAHTGAIMSGVLYLQSYGTGEIVFKSDRTVMDTYHPMWPYYGSARYKPDDGDLILFPSYLGHYVPSNPIDKERINIAFDVRFLEKKV